MVEQDLNFILQETYEWVHNHSTLNSWSKFYVIASCDVHMAQDEHVTPILLFKEQSRGNGSTYQLHTPTSQPCMYRPLQTFQDAVQKLLLIVLTL